LGLGFRQADAGDLRTAVGATRDVRGIHRVRVGILVAKLLAYALRADDSLVAGLVREPGGRGDVADRPDAGHVRAAHRIGLEEAAVGLDAEFLEADILRVGGDPYRNDGMGEALLGDLAVGALDLRGDALPVRDQAFDAGAGEDRHALLLEALGEEVA